MLRDFPFEFVDMFSVIETDPDYFLGAGDGSPESDVGRIEEKALNTAGRFLEITKLFFQDRKAVFNVQDLLDRKNDTWKLQEVIANGFCDVEARLSENAAEPYDIQSVLPGKIHEFHGFLL
jgi:hypothetical protein